MPHPRDEADELVCIGIEFALVASRYQLDVGGHGAERLLEVVRGDVGELLEFFGIEFQLVKHQPEFLVALSKRLLGTFDGAEERADEEQCGEQER